MGCDIHMFVETYELDRWVFREEVSYCRNYTLFGVLAGIRDAGVCPISEPRGEPADMSLNTEIPLWVRVEDLSYTRGDHSHSWVTAKEVLDYPWPEELLDEKQFIYEWLDPWLSHRTPEYVRFVFCFDS